MGDGDGEWGESDGASTSVMASRGRFGDVVAEAAGTGSAGAAGIGGVGVADVGGLGTRRCSPGDLEGADRQREMGEVGGRGEAG